MPEPTPQPPALQAEPVLLVAEHDSTYQPVQMTAEPAQEPEPVEEEDENEKIEAALLEQGYLHEEIPLDFDLQCHLIAVCEEYGVPQNVALGVIQAESSFTATAANGSCYCDCPKQHGRGYRMRYVPHQRNTGGEDPRVGEIRPHRSDCRGVQAESRKGVT